MENALVKTNDDRPIVAICYDFDRTLSPKEMQEYTLFPRLGVKAAEFWTESGKLAADNGMDKMLSYMRLIIRKYADVDDKLTLTKKDFEDMGKDVELFEGLDTWFDRINNYADGKGLAVEHYVISAGLKEIIDGTAIRSFFKEVYASSFIYNSAGVPQWPRQVVNYTQKTQYLFRINKNCLDLSDEESINKKKASSERRIPFTNFIYIGDSDTDIPAMQVIKQEKGLSIGVYDPSTKNSAKVRGLIEDERINFFAPADYKKGSVLELYVKKAIDKIKANEELARINKEARLMARGMKSEL